MRRRRVVKRELIPDVKYNSELVARLINTIMNRGKKSTAQQIIYAASAVRPIRFRSKSIRSVRSLWRCAGSRAIPAAARASR